MHGRPSWRRAAHGTSAAILAGALAVTVAPATYAATELPDPVVVEGDDWTVEQVPGGYEITLELDEPLPMRAAAPALEVDGEPVGLARESADGESVSVVTTDESVLAADDVALSWEGEDESAPRSFGTQSVDPDDTDAVAFDPPRLDVDPSENGEFTVARADYDLGTQAVELEEIGGIRGEMRAAVYYPVEAEGERPVVIFQHGRHTSCAEGTRNPDRYPCSEDQVEIPSYLGYTAPAETLASNGYVVVSVSANAINSNDNQLAIDWGATARGGLILSHLDLLAAANAGEAPALDPVLAGRLDLDHVGLMGHSRGGEGVVRAALMNEARGEPYGIESVLPLAPVAYGRSTLPDVPTYTVLPYCDGDVEDLMGQHYYEDSRYAADDNVLRATGLVMGANHNYFNTFWTPGLYDFAVSDDWMYQDREQTNEVCGQNAESRLTAAEQYQVGDVYISGWFRLTMGGEEEFLPMYDGTGAIPESAGRAEIYTVAQQPGDQRLDVAPLLAPSTDVRPVGDATATYCMSLSGRPYPQQLPACADSEELDWPQAPHWTPMRFAPSAPSGPMLNLSWSAEGGGVRIDVPAAGRDITDVDRLTFRAAPDENVEGTQEMAVTVVDGSGATWSTLVSDVSSALTQLPGTDSPLDKVYLRQVLVPVSDIEGIDTTDVRQVRLTGVGGSGNVYLSEVTLASPGVGTAMSVDLPNLYVSDATVNEGQGPGSAKIAVRIDEPADAVVSAHLEANGGDMAAERLAAPVLIPAGQTCAVFDVPLQGDRLASTEATTDVTVTAVRVSNASGADTFGRLTIREDDAVVDEDGIVHEMAPDPGPQGDACATEEPTDPGEPSEPGEPGEPGEPTDPEEPGEPTDPGQPGTQRYGFFLNDGWDAWADHVFRYGRFSDEVLVGDWDGDGTETITIRRGSEFHVSNAQQGGEAEEAFTYGRPGDLILVGDWDGDGTDTLAVRRGNEYHLKNTTTGGPADVVVRYGRPGDAVVVGDWDGEDGDTLTVRRGATYHVRNSLAPGQADVVLTYGRASDVVLAGDWDGDGVDSFAVRRGNVYHVKNTITGGDPDLVQSYGRATDEVYVGDWNGDNTDTLGVRRTP